MIRLWLAFVRSGYFELPTAGVLRNAGHNADYWSSRAGAYTSSTSATAYNLEFNTAMNPSNLNNRWYGFPLRCLDYAAAGADL